MNNAELVTNPQRLRMREHLKEFCTEFLVTDSSTDTLVDNIRAAFRTWRENKYKEYFFIKDYGLNNEIKLLGYKLKPGGIIAAHRLTYK